MSVCKCGTGHPLDCPVHKPAPSPQPEMPEGWKLDISPYYSDATRRHYSAEQTVTVDADSITVEERTSGYDGYTATVRVPLSVLRALLATQGLHVINAKQQAVLEVCAQHSEDSLRLIMHAGSHPWARCAAASELARRAAKEGT